MPDSFSKHLYNFRFLLAVCVRFGSFITSPIFPIVSVFTFKHPSRCMVILHPGFNLHFSSVYWYWGYFLCWHFSSVYLLSWSVCPPLLFIPPLPLLVWFLIPEFLYILMNPYIFWHFIKYVPCKYFITAFICLSYF